MQKRVIPVSPNTFYLYLQTVMLGLKGLEVEKNAVEIISALGRLKVDFERFSRDFRLIRTHLRNANACFDSADRKRESFEDRLRGIASPPSEEKGGAVSPSEEKEEIRDTTE
jgi:DNA recombination protein RmuC